MNKIKKWSFLLLASCVAKLKTINLAETIDQALSAQKRLRTESWVVAYSLILLWFVGILPAQGTEVEKMGFIQKLQAQEDAEYKQLIDDIKNMSRSEYSAFLNERIEKAYDGETGSLSVMIAVDVTDEMTQPEQSFFAKLFSQVQDKEMYGVSKVEKVLAPLKPNAKINETLEERLVLQSEYESQDKQKYFQRLNGSLDQQSAYMLASQNQIIDLAIADSQETENSFVSIDTATGRMLPRQVQKIYEPDFINAGLYDELISEFADKETLMVQVSFFEPVGYQNTKEFNDQSELAVERFLSSWSDYEFEVFHTSSFYVIMQTSKDHVLAMSQDERVSSISKGSLS